MQSPRGDFRSRTYGDSSIWPRLQIPAWLRQAPRRLLNTEFGIPERPQSPWSLRPHCSATDPRGGPVPPRSGRWRAAGSRDALRCSTSTSSCPTANPSERNSTSRRLFSRPRACLTPADVDLIPSWFGWRKIGVLKSSVAQRPHHSYLAGWERELRPWLPVFKQSQEVSSLTSFRIWGIMENVVSPSFDRAV